MLEIVNNARNRVDIGGPLIIQLPTGAGGAATMEGSSPSATVSGDVVTVQGPFAPGSTPVNVGFVLTYDRPDITIEQTWPAPVEQVTVGIERIGSVNMTSPQFSDSRRRHGAGRHAVPARDRTSACRRTARSRCSSPNLPVHSRTPVYVGLGLALAVMAFGAWLAFGGHTQARRPAPPPGPAARCAARRAGAARGTSASAKPSMRNPPRGGSGCSASSSRSTASSMRRRPGRGEAARASPRDVRCSPPRTHRVTETHVSRPIRRSQISQLNGCGTHESESPRASAPLCLCGPSS